MLIIEYISTKEAANLATVVAAFVGAFSLLALAYQSSRSRKIANGEFLLKLEDELHRHDEIRSRFAPGGEWATSGARPSSSEQERKLEDYMGFFEHCELLMQSGALVENHFFRLFGYLVEDMTKNDTFIDWKIDKDGRDHWRDFLLLLSRWKHYKNRNR